MLDKAAHCIMKYMFWNNLFKKEDNKNLVKVDLGCGEQKPKGFIGVDIVAGPQVDIVADLNGKFPFEDNSVDYLRADNALEHLKDIIKTMNEIYRVCKNGAIVEIIVPSTDGRGAFQDPTHVSYWNRNSFLYFTNKRGNLLHLGHKYGFKGVFKLLSLRHTGTWDKIKFIRAKLMAVK